MSDRYIIQGNTEIDGRPTYLKRITRPRYDQFTTTRTRGRNTTIYTANPGEALVLTRAEIYALEAKQYGTVIPAV